MFVKTLVSLGLFQILSLGIVALPQMIKLGADVPALFVLFSYHSVFSLLDQSFVFLVVLHSLRLVQVLVLHFSALSIFDLPLEGSFVKI